MLKVQCRYCIIVYIYCIELRACWEEKLLSLSTRVAFGVEIGGSSHNAQETIRCENDNIRRQCSLKRLLGL